MEKDSIDIFAQYLEATEKPGFNQDEYFAQHPKAREYLQALVPLVHELENMPDATPSDAFRKRSYNLLMYEIKKEKPKETVAPQTPSILYSIDTILRGLTKPLAANWVAVMLVAVLLFSTTGGVAVASNNAIPGDTLYPVKGLVEDTRLALADDTDDIALYLLFTEERIKEIEALIEQGKLEQLSTSVTGFENHITAISETLSSLTNESTSQGEELFIYIDQSLTQQIENLTHALDRAPHQRDPHINQSLDRSRRKHNEMQRSFPRHHRNNNNHQGSPNDGRNGSQNQPPRSGDDRNGSQNPPPPRNDSGDRQQNPPPPPNNGRDGHRNPPPPSGEDGRRR